MRKIQRMKLMTFGAMAVACVAVSCGICHAMLPCRSGVMDCAEQSYMPCVYDSLMTGEEVRELWINMLDRIARPVLENLSEGTLRENMPVESIDPVNADRRGVTHLEALGRTLTGIAPWLELGPDRTEEGRLRKEYIDMAVRSVSNAVDPASPDYMNFSRGAQPLVDAAFLAHGLLRAPVQLWGRLDSLTRERLVYELKSTRTIRAAESNWLLFPAIIEAALLEFTGEWDRSRVDYALRRHWEWYKGDGWYGDGKDFHFDYYNSFVIQPMLVEVLEVLERHGIGGTQYYDTGKFYEVQLARYARYAAIQERMISPEGTFPAVGRSLAYRFGAFQALSDVCYRHILPDGVSPAQVRSALTAVMVRQIGVPGTFDDNGWLRPGFCGHQPHIGENYISTGSLYLCTAVFIALGLPDTDPFWSSPAEVWTSVKIWNGADMDADSALDM